MHDEEENREEILRKHEEEGGSKNLTKIGDQAECPECKRSSRVVWISADCKTVGIRCPARHSIANRPESRLGSFARAPPKTRKNMVFMSRIE